LREESELAIDENELAIEENEPAIDENELVIEGGKLAVANKNVSNSTDNSSELVKGKLRKLTDREKSIASANSKLCQLIPLTQTNHILISGDNRGKALIICNNIKDNSDDEITTRRLKVLQDVKKVFGHHFGCNIKVRMSVLSNKTTLLIV